MTPRPSVVRSGLPRLSWGNCSLSCHSPSPRLPRVSQQPSPAHLFVSYCHKDERWLRKIETVLKQDENDTRAMAALALQRPPRPPTTYMERRISKCWREP